MTRILLPLVLFALSLVPGPPQAPSERGRGRIHLDVVAVDKNDVPVVDLKPEEVEVWIGHFRAPIESFTVVTPDANPSGRLTVLILDDVTLPIHQVSRAQEAARRFVNKMLPNDRMAIVSLDGSSMELTDDRTVLFKAIDRFNSLSGGLIPIDRVGEHVLTTIGTLSKQMVEAGSQRKTIVAIGSGWVFDRPIPPARVGMDPRKEWIGAMQAMAVSNISLYVIDPQGVSTARADSGGSGFARETGGLAFISTNDLNAAADRVLRESANYYLLGVGDPPVGRGADLREVDVKVLRRGVTVRARKLITGGS